MSLVRSDNLSEKLLYSHMPKLNINHVVNRFKELFEAVMNDFSSLEEERPLNGNDMNTSHDNNSVENEGAIQPTKSINAKDKLKDDDMLRNSWFHMSNDEIISSSSNDSCIVPKKPAEVPYWCRTTG